MDHQTTHFAQAVVEADLALFNARHLQSRVLEMGNATDADIAQMKTTIVRSQLNLDAAIALLGTCDEAFDDDTRTEDGKVIRAYAIALGKDDE